MRSFGVRLPILAATAWAGIGLTAFGRELSYGETVYLTPTAATYVLPTSYVSSDTYLVPTAYSFASYLPAAYIDEPVTLAPTSYLTTAYSVRRGLFGRLRLVERPVVASYATTYLPSSYIVPTYYTPPSYIRPTYYTTSYRTTSYTPTRYTETTYSYPRVWPSGYVRTSSADCEPVPCDGPVVASAYRSSSPVSSGQSSAGQSYLVPRSNGGSRSSANDMSDDPTIPSSVGPPPGEPEILNPVTEGNKSATPAEGRADSPPKPPLPAREQTSAQPAGSATGSQPQTKQAPANATKPAPANNPAEPEIAPAPIEGAGVNRRETLRPVYSTPRTLRTELRNVLLGRVESDAGDPIGEVPISVARSDDQSVQRTGMTNAFGNFAIRLTDGQWNVNVRMPSGRYYKVRTVTVQSGKIMDIQEQREVRNLVISY